MEQLPVTPAPVKHKNAVPLIVILVIIIAVLVGVLIWCLFYKPHSGSSGSGGSGGGLSTTDGASGPCTGGIENTLPAGFSFYESTEHKFKFAYPSAWGSVAITTTPMGGVGGHYMQGSFSANTAVTFGGNATDYIVQGRGGMPTDNPGFLQAGNKFYTVQIWTYRAGPPPPDEVQNDLFLLEDVTLKNGCNTKALVSQFPADVFNDAPYDVARINLQPTNPYYGVNFVLRGPDATNRADLDKLITSFQLLP
jgi:hypothetical protein